MIIKFYCPHWGSEHLQFSHFAENVKAAGFNGVEMSLPYDTSKKNEILQVLNNYNLELIAQHWETVDSNFETHKRNYRDRLYNLAAARPLFINSQTGKDFFNKTWNVELITIAADIAAETGIPIKHETHRGKFSFAAHITEDYLKLLPGLRLTLDISHWFAVAETYLEDQQDAVRTTIERTDHIHSRIGHTQGPQISDPRDKDWDDTIQVHLDIWDKIIARAAADQQDYFTITTEFGPKPYMTMIPFEARPIANQWEVNVYMMNLLKRRYSK